MFCNVWRVVPFLAVALAMTQDIGAMRSGATPDGDDSTAIVIKGVASPAVFVPAYTDLPAPLLSGTGTFQSQIVALLTQDGETDLPALRQAKERFRTLTCEGKLIGVSLMCHMRSCAGIPETQCDDATILLCLMFFDAYLSYNNMSRDTLTAREYQDLQLQIAAMFGDSGIREITQQWMEAEERELLWALSSKDTDSQAAVHKRYVTFLRSLRHSKNQAEIKSRFLVCVESDLMPLYCSSLPSKAPYIVPHSIPAGTKRVAVSCDTDTRSTASAIVPARAYTDTFDTFLRCKESSDTPAITRAKRRFANLISLGEPKMMGDAPHEEKVGANLLQYLLELVGTQGIPHDNAADWTFTDPKLLCLIFLDAKFNVSGMPNKLREIDYRGVKGSLKSLFSREDDLIMERNRMIESMFGDSGMSVNNDDYSMRQRDRMIASMVVESGTTGNDAAYSILNKMLREFEDEDTVKKEFFRCVDRCLSYLYSDGSDD